MAIPVSQVLKMVGVLCSDCQAKVRMRIAAKGQPWNGDEPLPGMARIVYEVCAQKEMPVDRVIKKCNERAMVAVRREIAIKARAAGFSFPEIGRALNRHHTTILHLVKDLL